MAAISRAATLVALTATFVMSQAFRTVFSVTAEPLSADVGISPRALGAAAGAFSLAFAAAQPAIGVSLDRCGPRRTVLAVFPLTVAGSALSAMADGPRALIAGQLMIGIGCAPALLGTMAFVARHHPADRFAGLSGIVFAVGGAGMLITGTPLAWIIGTWSWRWGFAALAMLAAAVSIAVAVLVPGETTPSRNASLLDELRGLRELVVRPQTAGICCLAATSYAAFLTLRGLWLGPLLAQRHGLTLVATGNVATAMSVAGVLGPLAFGYADPGAGWRRALIIACSLLYAALLAVLATGTGRSGDIALLILGAALAGFITLQYADLRAAYPPEQTGRALSVFTMAMFAGVAATQWMSGVAASLAPAMGLSAPSGALLAICALLTIGTIGFAIMPGPPSGGSNRSQAD